jgi:hypothetical protein
LGNGLAHVSSAAINWFLTLNRPWERLIVARKNATIAAPLKANSMQKKFAEFARIRQQQNGH